MSEIVIKAKTSIISKIPKKTWYIIVAILLALAGFFALSRSWFWICWEGVAMALVAVGCIGEFAMLRRIPAPGHEEKRAIGNGSFGG